MNESLKAETEKLGRAWMQHDSAWLKDYLVAGVEDPRLNLQSILARHFLVREFAGERFAALMGHEYRFAAALSWLMKLPAQAVTAEDFEAILHGLRRGADNAEGLEIPRYVLRIFQALPAESLGVPNYIELFLREAVNAGARITPDMAALDTFRNIWNSALPPLWCQVRSGEIRPISVIEPACGSANDYRFLESFGIAPFLKYAGFDLCEKNIENARTLFPQARFILGNVFEIAAADKSFDFCVVHDLFEHFSIDGLVTAVNEICRVTRKGICAGFFQMSESPDHVVRPLDEYHWNLLSLSGMQRLFAKGGFHGEALHIGSVLRQYTGCNETHNPNAYTLMLHAI